jgi:glycosyltransferase involved in cell wall biosynthesis
LSQYFNPEQFRINDIASQLIVKGHQVSVVTGIPNYPIGKFYPGYGYSKKRREVIDGIDVYRSFLIPRGKSKVQLVLNYLSFVIGGFFTLNKIKGTFDVIFIYEVSPMLQALPAIWYAKSKRIPTVLYVTDLWPESVQHIGNVNSKIILSQLTKVSKYIYDKTNKILVSSPGFSNRISLLCEYADTQYLPIYAEDEYFQASYSPKSNEIFSFVFAGNIGEAQGLDVILDAMRTYPTDETNFIIKIIGEGRSKARLIRMVEQYKLHKRIFFYGRKNINDTINLVTSSDVALVCLSSNPINELTIPAKMQSLMAMGMPVLAIGEGQVLKVVSDAQCGLATTSIDLKMIQKKFKQFAIMSQSDLNEFSLNAKNYYLENYSKKRFFESLLSVFQNLMEENNDC